MTFVLNKVHIQEEGWGLLTKITSSPFKAGKYDHTYQHHYDNGYNYRQEDCCQHICMKVKSIFRRTL